MNKDEFNGEEELARWEKEMGTMIRELDPAPLRAGFQEKLRQKLHTKVKQMCQKHEKKPLWGGWRKMGSFWRGCWRYRLPLSVGVVLLFLVVGALFWGKSQPGFVTQPVLASAIEISALEKDALGVKAESAFLLSSEIPLEEAVIKNNLKIEPEFAYKLQKGAGGREYKIIPHRSLAANKVYKLSFDPEGKERESFSWAFQTKGDFQILRTLPGNETVGVPLDTGIEITFSHENFDEQEIEKYFTISPAVKGRFEKHKKTLVFVPQQLTPETLYTVTLQKGLPLSGSEEVLAEDYGFIFETQVKEKKEVKFRWEMTNLPTEFTTCEEPFFSVLLPTKTNIPPVNIDLYSFTAAALIK